MAYVTENRSILEEEDETISDIRNREKSQRSRRRNIGRDRNRRRSGWFDEDEDDDWN